MNHEKPYTEMMKSSTMGKQVGKDTFMLELYVDMMLQEAILKSEKKRLLRKIDESLDERNEEYFTYYTNELMKLNKKFGS